MFYEWEKRGRGWFLWERPVDLEPPFRPFSWSPPSAKAIDDGRRHTWLSAGLERFFGGTGTPSIQATSNGDDFGSIEPQPSFITKPSRLVELQVTPPADLDVAKIAAEHLLLSLGGGSGPLALEIIGTAHVIVVQFVSQQSDTHQLGQQLQAHFPESMVTAQRGFLYHQWSKALGPEPVIVDFGLSQEFVRPLQTFRNFDVDPFVGLVGTLNGLADNEVGVYQVLFQPTQCPWAQSIFRSVTDWQGGSFFVDAPEMVALAKEKISRPLYATVIRVAASSTYRPRSWEIVRRLGSALGQYSHPASNELIPLTNKGYPGADHEADLLNRQSRRTGMILNSDELAGLVHLPSASVRCEKLQRRVRHTKAAPAIALGHELELGENFHNGKTSAVSLSPDQRTKHVYLVGASGTGKSNLLLKLIAQDMQNGRGLAVLDPHGDLIDQVLDRVPEDRIADVILFDPSDEQYPIGFNILSAHSEVEKTLLASDLVALFRRLSTSWGDQMTTVFNNAIAAFLESGRGGTLADLRRFLAEKEFRREFLPTVQDQDIVYYWEREFPLLSGRPQGPILTRLDAFLRPKLIRYMVAQKDNRLDFAGIMNSGKILLAKLSQGAIGEENAYLLGTFLVSKFHQLTLSRQELHESKRRAFYIYLDEFHNFVTPSMAAILAGVRKYRLGLTLAHQELRQLENRDPEVASAVLANAYTRICFRVGDTDAKKLAEGFAFYEASDLQNLGTGEAICRIERAEYDFNLRTPLAAAVNESVAEQRRVQIIQHSRARYATPKADVEALLNAARAYAPLPSVPPAPDRKAAATVTSEPMSAEPKPVASKARVPRRTPQRLSPEPPLMGKGGHEHKYLQNLIKRWAEGMGYRATIEKQLPDGSGSVDVTLEKNGLSIACEISVTTTADRELANVEKCLRACFESLCLCSSRQSLAHQVYHSAPDHGLAVVRALLVVF